MMKRRSATLALSAIIGALSGKVKAAETWTTSDKVMPLKSIALPPFSVSFDLKAYTSYNFSYEGKTITLTPEEMFRALSE